LPPEGDRILHLPQHRDKPFPERPTAAQGQFSCIAAPHFSVSRPVQSMLASYLGLTPETVSRIRKNLSRR
jgi:hypothetical protein